MSDQTRPVEIAHVLGEARAQAICPHDDTFIGAENGKWACSDCGFVCTREELAAADHDMTAVAVDRYATAVSSECAAREQELTDARELIAGWRAQEAALRDAHGSTKVWCCRFHPTNWWHEVGCPHREWSDEQLRDAGSAHILDRSAARERQAFEAGIASIRHSFSFDPSSASGAWTQSYQVGETYYETAEDASAAYLTSLGRDPRTE